MMDEGLHVRKFCSMLLAQLSFSWSRATEQALLCYEEKKLLHGRGFFMTGFSMEPVLCSVIQSQDRIRKSLTELAAAGRPQSQAEV